MYWLIIILGTFIISLSISNPFYRLIVKKIVNLKIFYEIIFRILLFFLSIGLIFLGLYLESI